jgi:Leucine-rich repeat (LRR) protein
MCNTRSAFENCSIQISDALPNLVELSIDYCNDLIKLPDGFCNITTLKKLSITNCHKLSAIPQDIGKLENLEVLRLCSCSDLEEMPESVAGLNELRCFDISDCVSLPNLPNDIGDLQKLEKLYMKGCSNLSELPNSVINFGNRKHKISVICDEEGASLWEHFPDIPNLKIEMPKVEINLNWLHGTRS